MGLELEINYYSILFYSILQMNFISFLHQKSVFGDGGLSHYALDNTPSINAKIELK
jgi:hypothetical protein